MGVRKTLVAALIGAGAALTSAPALSSHLPGLGFNEQQFTFDPTSFCDTLLTCQQFTATFIDFSYQAEVDQTGSNFTETGFAFFSTFQASLGDPVLASISGLNVDYKMYAVFQASGTSVVNGAGGIDGTFDTFNAFLVVDPDLNTSCSTATGTTVCTGQADDQAILFGTLDEGGFHVFPGLAAGDFDVIMTAVFNPAIWGGPAFSGDTVQVDMNGVNTQIAGVTAPPSDFTNGSIIGSGNVSFAPEPGSLSLLGLSLLGLGAMMRRRRSWVKAA